MRQGNKGIADRTCGSALLALAVLVAVFAFPAPAQAQDDSYVDLSVEVVSDHSHSFTARNHGTATAYGVTMDIALTLAGEEQRSIEFEQKSGTSCSGNIPGTTCINGTFPVGTLAPGEEKSFYISPKLAPGLPCCSNPINDYWAVPARAVVKNTIPGEEERFKGDNTDTKWISANGHDGLYNASHAIARYWLEASVDDLLPEAGDTVKFSLKAERLGGTAESVFGAKVRLKLDDGMGTPTAGTFAAATGLTRTWDWDFDIEQPYRTRTLEVSTTLDNPLPAGVAVSDLCLTAELTARPDNLGVVGRVTYTTAEICLREDPVVLLQEGAAILFNMYPCVGVTAYPCTSSDTLELRVVGGSANAEEGSAAREAGIARDEAILDPDRVFIQVKDPEARIIDTQSTSVNSGTAPSWQTAREPDHRSGDRTVGGVEISYTRREFDSTQIANYSNLARTMAVTALDGGAAPGLVKVRYPGSGNTFYDLTTTGSHERPTFGLNSTSTTVFKYFAEFTTLGTYKMDFTAAVTHTDTNVYSDTGSYIFHVGPVAELEARDNGPNPELASTQRAFTIVAVNNGPDDAPAAQVTVTDLNTSDYVSHNASHGTFDSTTGVWTIGELRDDSVYYRTTGHPLGWPSLTIVTSAAEDTEITAAISNAQDYQVCIDSSAEDVAAGNQADCKTESGNTNAWHAAVCVNTADNEIDSTITVEATCDSTTDRAWTENVCASSAGGVLAAHTEAICFGWHTAPYYDYLSDNNSATIKAKDGTGADLPALGSPEAGTAAIKVTWDPITEVNGRRVTHYEVQKQTNPWETVAKVLETSYVDNDVAAGDTRSYRVRAVNDRGLQGAWSAPMEGTVPVPETPEPPEPIVQERVVTETVTVTVSEDPYAYFVDRQVSRAVAENSAPRSPVGAPVAVVRNPGNRVTYTLEGADAALFGIERDSGQILVGEGTMLDFESDRTGYSVEVVATPDLSGRVRTSVSIGVVDVTESAAVSISPDEQPQVGETLTATLTHGGGEPVDPSWQWQRSTSDGLWAGIRGAGQARYTPTERDAGARLRVIVTYSEPDGDGESVAGAVTQALAGDPATGPVARYDADGDGRIDVDEVITAIADYFAGSLDFGEVMEVIGVYYAG